MIIVVVVVIIFKPDACKNLWCREHVYLARQVHLWKMTTLIIPKAMMWDSTKH